MNLGRTRIVVNMHSPTVVLLITLLSGVLGVTYDGHKVYKLVAKTQDVNDYLNYLASSSDFDFWSKINKVGNPVTVMVSPKAQTVFEDFLIAKSVAYEILIENVQYTIDAEREYHRLKPKSNPGRITFDQYLQHDEINTYLNQIAEDYPDIVTLGTLGQSYEGREMNLVRISSGPTDSPKPVIFIDAGIHAREWIAPALALYLINQLVENLENRDLIENVDWIILPCLNPDGYEFSWESDRLWRKTVSPGTLCNGCDGNRNFGFHWMETGASSWECSETYAGREAFSEVETQNLRDYLNSTSNIVAYLTLHSYGQYLLYPWGYIDSLCDNWKELDDLGHAIDEAISAVRGTSYTVGGSTATLYAAAGASDDWAKSIGIDIVYTVELPGGGIYGFDLPPSEIQPVVEETFLGLRVLGTYIANRKK